MKAAVDGLLKDSVGKGDVPGVVAVATDAKGTTYEGGFGKRVLGQAAEMTPDTVAWMASQPTGQSLPTRRGSWSLGAPSCSRSGLTKPPLSPACWPGAGWPHKSLNSTSRACHGPLWPIGNPCGRTLWLSKKSLGLSTRNH
jgi:hypothetical protein